MSLHSLLSDVIPAFGHRLILCPSRLRSLLFVVFSRRQSIIDGSLLQQYQLDLDEAQKF